MIDVASDQVPDRPGIVAAGSRGLAAAAERESKEKDDARLIALGSLDAATWRHTPGMSKALNTVLGNMDDNERNDRLIKADELVQRQAKARKKAKHSKKGKDKKAAEAAKQSGVAKDKTAPQAPVVDVEAVQRTLKRKMLGAQREAIEKSMSWLSMHSELLVPSEDQVSSRLLSAVLRGDSNLATFI